jgi:lipopolysaccharide biosynthesis regulator YciM
MKNLLLRALLIAMLCSAACSQSRSAIAKSPGIKTHLQRAEAALRSNDPETATREFGAVLTLDPKNAEAHANLGVMAFFRGDCETASVNLREALSAAPSLAKAQALLGICLRRSGDPSASALLEKSFPKLTEPKLRMLAGMQLIGIYEQRGELDHAAPIMASLVDADPDDVNLLYVAQRIYSELADDTLNKLTIIAPGSARMQQVIAERLVNAGDVKGAIEHYRKALAIDPRLPGIRYELSEAILESSPSSPDSQNEAEKELQGAIAADGDTASIECELGHIARLRSDADQAYLHYSKAYRLNPGEVEAQMGLARVLMEKEKLQEAVPYLRATIAADPLNGEAHYRLGTAYRMLQMPDQAQTEIKLFQEIKKTKEQVRALYRQMNRTPKPEEDAESSPMK